MLILCPSTSRIASLWLIYANSLVSVIVMVEITIIATENFILIFEYIVCFNELVSRFVFNQFVYDFYFSQLCFIMGMLEGNSEFPNLLSAHYIFLGSEVGGGESISC